MRRSVPLAAVALSLGIPCGLGGQEAFVFEFRPDPGSRVHTVYEVDGVLTVVGLPDLPDSSTGATTARVSMTRRVLEVLDGAFVVTESVDSVRGRYRLRATGAWTPFDVAARPAAPTRVLLDSRMSPTPLEEPADPWEDRVIRGLRGLPDVALPRAPVSPGDRWDDIAVFPYTVEMPGDPASVVSIDMDARAALVLDSLVVRPLDTLAYVSVRGGFSPLSVDAAYSYAGVDRPVTVWGSFSATLIWSTGWQAWVSGGSTLRMFHRVEGAAPRDSTAITIRADLTSRLRVRP